MIQIKRAYDETDSADGMRFLVDRLWPRGVKKEALSMEAWLKETAPSNNLRHWYHHDPDQWNEFRRRYFKELEANPDAWQPILKAARLSAVTLLYSSKHTEHNNAVALKEFLMGKLRKKAAR